MQIIETVYTMRDWSERERREDRRIALVPTMGPHDCAVREATGVGRIMIKNFCNSFRLRL